MKTSKIKILWNAAQFLANKIQLKWKGYTMFVEDTSGFLEKGPPCH